MVRVCFYGFLPSAPGQLFTLTVGLSGFSPQVVSPEERFWNASGAAFVTVQEPG